MRLQAGCHVRSSRFRRKTGGNCRGVSSTGGTRTVSSVLLGPDEDQRPAAILLIEDEPRATPLDIVERQVHAIRIEIDAVVAEKRHPLAARSEAQQPERD